MTIPFQEVTFFDENSRTAKARCGCEVQAYGFIVWERQLLGQEQQSRLVLLLLYLLVRAVKHLLGVSQGEF